MAPEVSPALSPDLLLPRLPSAHAAPLAFPLLLELAKSFLPLELFTFCSFCEDAPPQPHADRASCQTTPGTEVPVLAWLPCPS